MSRSLKSLMRRLNSTSRSALEAAAGMCLSRTQYEVEIEHWFLKLLELPECDVGHACRYFGVELASPVGELRKAVDTLKTGNSRNPTLSPTLVKLVEESWLIASLEFGADNVRSGHLLLALHSQQALWRQMNESVPSFSRLPPEKLVAEFSQITAKSCEGSAHEATPASESKPVSATESASGALDKYTQNLTAAAREGRLDSIVGRDEEIRQVVDILMRRRQNNPILTGEAGVGKTAVVEGLACQIAAGQVPPPVRNVQLRSLDLALLQAGAGIKGEFENRLRSVIDEVKASPVPIILFIDEAHSLIGAGGAAGQGDAANLLKPALARGELRTIAATTWTEYKRYFERDAALTRRFQVVKVDEPSEYKAIQMLRPVAARLEAHHNVLILSRAVEEAVILSSRYLTGRQLPDKAVSVLDTACARVAVSQCAIPSELEDCQRRQAALDMESSLLRREAAAGLNHEVRLAEIEEEQRTLRERHGALEAQWESERRIVSRLLELHQHWRDYSPEQPTPAAADEMSLREEHRRLERELADVQGDAPLMHPCVDVSSVADVISRWTGIPIGKMLQGELDTVRALEELLAARVVGQSQAIKAIAQRIQTSRANLDDPGKPVGVFLLVGPSGVGKTETALALADILYGGERNLITVNMSEFQEKHSVSSLKGAPPGYVGYGEGGVLTEAVRRKPYSVVLLDEIEKAHPDVLKLFYQVFDKGTMDDGEGREIDFKNTVILLTSNLGTAAIVASHCHVSQRPDPENLLQVIRPALLRHLEPALLGRMIVLPYYPLGDEQLERIVRMKLDLIARRMAENHRLELSYGDEVVQEVGKRCTEVDSGARNIDHILTRTLLPDISRELLGCLAEGKRVTRIRVRLKDGGSFSYLLESQGG